MKGKKAWLVAMLAALSITAALPLAAPQQAQAAQKELKVAILANLKSPQGVEMQKWIELFAKVYNEKGGWQIGGEKYLVKAMVYDCGYNDVSKTRSAMERATLQDGVKFIVASWEDVAEESVVIGEANKTVWMGTSWTNGTVDPKYKYEVRGMGIFFGLGLPYHLQRDAKLKGAKTDLIVNPDTQMGKAGTALWSGAARVAGLQVLDPIYFNTSTTDFGPLATKVKNINPDFVEIPYNDPEQIPNLMSALKDVGFKGMINPGDVTPYTLDNTVKKVGKQFVEGWECIYFDPKDFNKDPEMVGLMDRYIKEYKEWHNEGCHWIQPWFLFQDAVNSTQSVDVDTIVKYLRNSKKGVKTIFGYDQLVARPDLNNYATVDAAADIYVSVVKDGKLVPLKTVPAKDQYLISIKAMGLTPIYKKYWQEYGKPTFPQKPSLYDYADMN